MAAIVASKVKRIRKQRDADSQQNLRTAVGNSQNINRGKGDPEFENNGDVSPSPYQRQVTNSTVDDISKLIIDRLLKLKTKTVVNNSTIVPFENKVLCEDNII